MKNSVSKIAVIFILGLNITFSLVDAAPKPITLKVWEIWASDTDVHKKPFTKVLSDFRNSYPDIHLEVEAVENQTYKTTIKTALMVNEAPDIFYTWGAGFAKPFVEAGKVLDLSPYLDNQIKNKLLPGTLTNVTYNERIYGLPFEMWCGIFYCNQELFTQNHLKIPETFSELLETVKAFRTKGITPITLGERERWPGMFYQNILALRIGGTKLIEDALNKKASFNQPTFVESAAKLRQLVNAGAFNEDCLNLTREASEKLFIQGKVPMYFSGSWVAGFVEKEGSPVKGKIIAKRFPLVEGGQGNTDEFLGGAVDSFMVSARTNHKQESVKVIKYLAENMSREAYLAGGGLPCWKATIDTRKVNPLTLQIVDLVKNAKGFVLAWDTFFSGSDADNHLDLVQEIFAGTITPEQFAKEMQKINQK